jgi:hypothetical protein
MGYATISENARRWKVEWARARTKIERADTPHCSPLNHQTTYAKTQPSGFFA